MPVFSINADNDPEISDPRETLLAAAASLRPNAPIVVMVHGFRYSPTQAAHDPHRHILSLQPAGGPRRAMSWPRALGFGQGRPDEGLAVAFGWEARGRLGRAYAQAGLAGDRLALLVSDLASQARRPVAMIGHSLGARVVLAATGAARPGSVGRLVLLAGAEFRDAAGQALQSGAGPQAEVLNITSRENDLFDFALEQWLSRGRRQALGFGLESAARNWADIQIDNGNTLAALEALGFPTERQAMRLSHRTPYRRRGLFEFYRTALCEPWALPMGLLRAHLDGSVEPRWSRLLARPAAPRMLGT